MVSQMKGLATTSFCLNRYLQGFLFFCVALSYRNIQSGEEMCILPNGLAAPHKASEGTWGASQSPALT